MSLLSNSVILPFSKDTKALTLGLENYFTFQVMYSYFILVNTMNIFDVRRV